MIIKYTCWRDYYHYFFYILNEEIVIGAIMLFWIVDNRRIWLFIATPERFNTYLGSPWMVILSALAAGLTLFYLLKRGSINISVKQRIFYIIKKLYQESYEILQKSLKIFIIIAYVISGKTGSNKKQC